MDETRHPQTPHPGHETTDVNIWAVGKFGMRAIATYLTAELRRMESSLARKQLRTMS